MDAGNALKWIGTVSALVRRFARIPVVPPGGSKVACCLLLQVRSIKDDSRRARQRLPADKGVDDYEQMITAMDLPFERRKLQLWAEVMHSIFEVSRAGDDF